MYKIKFKPGQILFTPGAAEALDVDDAINSLRRHARGDWGVVSENDKAANEEALVTGGRILSAYTDRNGIKFWIITEWDRSATTILLPSEY